MTTPGLVRIVVDGREVQVAPGTNVVDAAHGLGIEVPIFCHHPRLAPVGMCRMCLVEVGVPRKDRATGELVLDETGEPVIDFGPKPVAGCTTFATEGMTVRTTTPTVAGAREDVLEFLLTSHPLDCPVCDKGGECPLQNLTMRYGPGTSRFPWSAKYHFPKPVPLGPLIALDRERCVLCARCIRFQEEVADDPVLDFANRGRGMEIVSLSDPPFASYFSGNTTDVCPVGALTTTDFRFEARAWEVVPRPSVCVHCPVGCNLALDVRGHRIMRVMPRQNDAVNEVWVCDKGRFAHGFATDPGRLTTPMVRNTSGDLEPASWEEAMQRAHAGLAEVRDKHGAAGLGGIAGDGLANEDLYLFGRLFRGVLGTNNVDHQPGILRDDLVARAGPGPETNLTTLGKGQALLVVGLDVEEEAPVLYLNLHKAARRGAAVVIVGGRPQKLDADAAVALRWAYGAEASLVEAVLGGSVAARAAGTRGANDGSVEVRAASEAPTDLAGGQHPVRSEDVREACALLASADRVLVLYGSEAARLGLAPPLAELVSALGAVGEPGHGLVAVGPHANSQGAADMGILPDWLPGYEPIADAAARSRLGEIWPAAPPAVPGLTAEAMLDGGVRGMLIAGADPVGHAPAGVDPLAGVEFLVVSELYLTATAARADVVLPAQSAAERDGTFTNLLRRVQRFQPAVRSVGEAREDWRIFRDLGTLFGAREPYSTAEDVRREIAAAVPQYAQITDQALGAEMPPGPGSVLLPFAPQTSAREVQYEGTSYAFHVSSGVSWRPNASAVSAERERAPAPALVSAEGLRLVTAPRLYDRGALMAAAWVLAPLVPDVVVEMSAYDANPRGLFEGMTVRLITASGSLDATVLVRDGLTPGTVVLPDVAADGAVRGLMGGEVSVPVAVERVT